MNDKEIKDYIQKEKLEVPVSYSQFIDTTLTNLPVKKKKNKVPFILSGVAALFLLVISSTVSDTVADTMKRLPFIGPIFEEIGDSGLDHASKKGLTTEVNETISTDTISLTITDVLYDGTRLSLAYMKQNIDVYEDGYMNHFADDFEILIDGKQLSNFGTGIRAEKVDEHTIAGVVDINTEEPLDDQFSLTLKIKELDSKKGHWKVTIPVAKISEKTILLQDQKTYNDETWKLTKVSLTPATTKVSFDVFLPTQAAELDRWDIAYQLIDDKGMHYRPYSSHGSGSPLNDEEWINKSSAVFAPVPDTVEYLIFQAVLRPINEDISKRVKSSLSNGLPLEMSQGEVGKLIITNIDSKEDETLVYLKVEGKDPYRQAKLLFTDKEGIEYQSDQVPQKISEEEYLFKVTFPKLPPIEQLTAVTFERVPPKLIEELRFKIPVE